MPISFNPDIQHAGSNFINLNDYWKTRMNPAFWSFGVDVEDLAPNLKKRRAAHLGAWPSTHAERMLETDNDLANFKQQQRQIAEAIRNLGTLEHYRGKDLLANPNSVFASGRTVATTADFFDQSGIQNATITTEFVPPTFTFDGLYSYVMQMDAQFAVDTVNLVNGGGGTSEEQYLVNDLSLPNAAIENTGTGHTCSVEAYIAGLCSNPSSFSDISSFKAKLSNTAENSVTGVCSFPYEDFSTNLGILYNGTEGVPAKVTIVSTEKMIIGVTANKAYPTEIEFLSSSDRLDCWFGGEPYNLKDGPLPYPPPPVLKSGWSTMFMYDDENYPDNNSFPYGRINDVGCHGTGLGSPYVKYEPQPRSFPNAPSFGACATTLPGVRRSKIIDNRDVNELSNCSGINVRSGSALGLSHNPIIIDFLKYPSGANFTTPYNMGRDGIMQHFGFVSAGGNPINTTFFNANDFKRPLTRDFPTEGQVFLPYDRIALKLVSKIRFKYLIPPGYSRMLAGEISSINYTTGKRYIAVGPSRVREHKLTNGEVERIQMYSFGNPGDPLYGNYSIHQKLIRPDYQDVYLEFGGPYNEYKIGEATITLARDNDGDIGYMYFLFMPAFRSLVSYVELTTFADPKTDSRLGLCEGVYATGDPLCDSFGINSFIN